MSAPNIQANYEQLEDIARRFTGQAEIVTELKQKIQQHADDLNNEWQGDSAKAFFSELETIILPTLHRLQTAFEESSITTNQIITTFQNAEEEAAQQFVVGDGQIGISNGVDAAIIQENVPIHPSSQDWVDTNPDEIFNEDYMREFVGTHYQGEDSAALNQLMEDLLKADPNNQEHVHSLLEQIADLRGIDGDVFRQQYETYLTLIENAGTKGAINLDWHPDFMGSTASLRYGAVVGDVFGIDPVFGALLNPTGGLVGPGSYSYEPGDTDILGYHGVFHDAAGYLLNYHDLGPGYDYLGLEPFFDSTHPLTGQLGGIAWWANLADTNMSPSNILDNPFIPDFIESIF